MNDEDKGGWSRPQRQRTLPELKALIAEAEANLAALNAEADVLVQAGRLEAIAQARNIMRAQQLSLADVIEPRGRRAPRVRR